MFCPNCNIGIDYLQTRERHCNNCGHDWEVFHVYPVNDIEIHKLSHTCICNPLVSTEGKNMVCTHNSFDGREGLEWVQEILDPR